MYCVTRQRYYGLNEFNCHCVEVAEGGIDYCGPNALQAQYTGEFQEFQDPRKAVEVAISIADKWKQDNPNLQINVAMGCNFGFTIPFSPQTVDEIRSKAQKIYDTLEKCPRCQSILPEKDKRWYANDWDGIEYCSEQCAQYAMDFELQS